MSELSTHCCLQEEQQTLQAGIDEMTKSFGLDPKEFKTRLGEYRG